MKNYAGPPLEGNPREAEAWALTQAALRMKDAAATADREAMLGAARLNWRLWTIIQAELLAPDCPLPMDIRSNVLSLSNFIDKHTVTFISDPRPERLDVLININRELAGGLYTRPADAPAATAAEDGAEPPAGPPPSIKTSV
ncbi:MAG: flagellar biosynthesis regulator FlaF [Rhodobacterales bacterium]|nr:flagellar biosynthesis regulator FlaF [Rhodobacterales bacterium]